MGRVREGARRFRGHATGARWVRLSALVVIAFALPGCRVLELLGYALFREFPRFADGEVVRVPGLEREVAGTQSSDGVWHVSAVNEHDAMIVLGFVQARDRLAQLDLFRHMARGELAAFIGNRPMGDRDALDVDRLNRFLGFRRDADTLYGRASAEEKAALDAFVEGMNRWIERGVLPLEHRLLGSTRIRPWTATDSLAIYLMIMHSLSGNADREVRRLALACAAGLEAAERIWPGDLEFDVHALPDEDLRPQRYPPQPVVVPELAAELPRLCATRSSGAPSDGAVDQQSRAGGLLPTDNIGELAALLASGLSASNNWAVAGNLTRSGRPILSTDPHLPHMNPPILWGLDVQIGEHRVAGFTLPGLHRVVFGHNGHVAWGATTNHVDRQDLFVLRPTSEVQGGKRVDGYVVDDTFVPFTSQSETFEVRGEAPVTATVRFTVHGPLLNDLDPTVAEKIPLTALRLPPPGRGGDLDGARAMNVARTADELAAGLALVDLGCSSWLFADTSGRIAYRSPCLVPIRDGWRGTFPVAGWISRYDWQGSYAKEDLPASTDPERGWLATANNQIVPSERFPTAYNNDVSAPNRFVRIARRIAEEAGRGGLDAASSAAIQLDVRYEDWPMIRRDLDAGFCSNAAGGEPLQEPRRFVCAWDGSMRADSAAATLYALWSNALVDLALADEVPGGASGELWLWVKSLLQFEVDAHWLWTRPADDPVWDDATTETVERRDDILELAFADAVAAGTDRYGRNVEAWQWGRVRPFVLHHPFAPDGGLVGWLLNSSPIVVEGDGETVFKQQYPRSDAARMRPAVGPVARLTVDLADPWAATYTLAGGQSGWPGSPFYANLLVDWAAGHGQPLTPQPAPEDTRVRFLPAS